MYFYQVIIISIIIRQQYSGALLGEGVSMPLLSMLVFVASPSTLANVPSLGSCVPGTEEDYLPCYLTHLLFGISM